MMNLTPVTNFIKGQEFNGQVISLEEMKTILYEWCSSRNLKANNHGDAPEKDE